MYHLPFPRLEALFSSFRDDKVNAGIPESELLRFVNEIFSVSINHVVHLHYGSVCKKVFEEKSASPRVSRLMYPSTIKTRGSKGILSTIVLKTAPVILPPLPKCISECHPDFQIYLVAHSHAYTFALVSHLSFCQLFSTSYNRIYLLFSQSLGHSL